MQVNRWCGWLSSESSQAEKNLAAVSVTAPNPANSESSVEEQVEQKAKLTSMFVRDQRHALSHLTHIVVTMSSYLPSNLTLIVYLDVAFCRLSKLFFEEQKYELANVMGSEFSPKVHCRHHVINSC